MPSLLRDLIVIVVIAVVASFLIKTYLIRSFYIPSDSMQNTLQENDRILVDELVPGLIPLQRGDVVVFKDPGGWLTDQAPLVPTPLESASDWVLNIFGLSPEDANDHLIKRVIGLPGDKVVCCDTQGRMSVNGVPLTEPYLFNTGGTTSASSTSFSVTVPQGDLWVMGDHRDDSKDSRYNTDTKYKGFVPISDVVGRAFVISWPLSRWSVLSNYPNTFKGVPAASK
jgi:signal peptidase I